MSKRRTAAKGASNNVMTIRLDGDLERDLTEARALTKLSRSDLARMSMERGLKILMQQLNAPVGQTPPAMAA